MRPPGPRLPDNGRAYLIAPRYWQWLGFRSVRVVLLWLIALGIGGQRLWHARHAFDNPPSEPTERQRVDGNSGHAEIDFGGQWIMGRMLLEGHARQLYHREQHWPLVRSAYPIEQGKPIVNADRLRMPHHRVFPTRGNEDLSTDAEWMMYWFMGKDSPEWKTLGGSVAAASTPLPFPPGSLAVLLAVKDRVASDVVADLTMPHIGGPLYPPIHAFVMAPFAIGNDPRASYRIAQIIGIGLVYLAALGGSMLSRGRVWWSVASIAVLLYPGCRACLDLGQNSALTLNFVIWGWVLASRGWTAAGGAAWGLLAIKPTWAIAFLLVPLLTRRWRFLFAMCGVGASLALATLPVVGVQTWLDWLEVGREASIEYDVDENWIRLSRDLQGLPRRWLLDFHKPRAERHHITAAAIGWSLWAGVAAVTVGLALTRGDRRRFVGIAPAFLFLGAYLTCYRFMYYDALVSFIAVAVLVADRDLFGRATILQWRSVPIEHVLDDRSCDRASHIAGYVNSFPLTLVVLLGLYENLLIASEIRSTVSLGFLAGSDAAPRKLEVDGPLHLALDTLLLVGLWGWCAVRLLIDRRGSDRCHAGLETPRSESSAAPMSADRISDSPTSTA